MTNQSMFPELETKRVYITAGAIKAVRELPRPDNTPYLTAMRQFREAYHRAEQEHGAVEISKLEFRKIP